MKIKAADREAAEHVKMTSRPLLPHIHRVRIELQKGNMKYENYFVKLKRNGVRTKMRKKRACVDTFGAGFSLRND